MTQADTKVRAVLIEEFGGPAVLKVAEIAQSDPHPGDVVVELVAAGINFWDCEIRAGIAWPSAVAFPHVLGTDGAGVVVAVGEGVSADRLGEQVVCWANTICGHCSACMAGHGNRCESQRFMGLHAPGTYAERVTVRADNAVAFLGLSFMQAASVGIPFVTAWHLLVERARIKPGDSVLIVGAGGDVGFAAVQIARLLGARVTALTSSERKRKQAIENGAAEVFLFDSGDPWQEAQRAIGSGFDFVVDQSGTETILRSLSVLRPGGSLLVVGCATGGIVPAVDLHPIYQRHLSLLGSSSGTHDDLRKVLSLMTRGELQPPDPVVLPLSSVQRAHELVESGMKQGSMVLEVGAP